MEQIIIHIREGEEKQIPAVITLQVSLIFI